MATFLDSDVAIDFGDVQGNILRGYRVQTARHFALRIGAPEKARAFLRLLDANAPSTFPCVTTALMFERALEQKTTDNDDAWMLNIAFTWDGLSQLGVAQDTLAKFPRAFREGPAKRAVDKVDREKQMVDDPDKKNQAYDPVGLGDVRRSHPDHWTLGNHAGRREHIILSLYNRKNNGARDVQSQQLRELFQQHDLSELSHYDADALPDGRVHFGYRDGIAQPHVEGVQTTYTPEDERQDDFEPSSRPGEFLLGKDYINQYDGNFRGDLPAELTDNGTYVAIRILEQDAIGFENFLRAVGERCNMSKELVAAKLMGRWRNGVPLMVSPDDPNTRLPPAQYNNFDYKPSPEHPTYYDDSDGLRCPIGSHVRRMNPRGSMAMGIPHSRRIIRRGMPYGPALDLGEGTKRPGYARVDTGIRRPTFQASFVPEESPELVDDRTERGLIGVFICGDLEFQYEFLLEVWANKDLAMAGLRNTRDPIVGAQRPQGGRYVIRTDDSRDPVVFDDLPTFVTTRGSVYGFMPGIDGIRYLAGLT